jgi:hypothetical protein
VKKTNIRTEIHVVFKTKICAEALVLKFVVTSDAFRVYPSGGACNNIRV